MKHILSLIFSKDQDNIDEEIELFGETYKITQFCTNFDIELTESIIKKYDGNCDVICVSGIPQRIKLKKGYYLHPDSYRIKTAAKYTPLVDGQIIKEVYTPYALRILHLKNQKFLARKKIAFYCATLQQSLVEVLEDLGNKLVMADPYFITKMPFNLHSTKSLNQYLKIIVPILNRISLKKINSLFYQTNTKKNNHILNELLSCDLFVENESTLNLLGHLHLKGKSLIIDTLSPTLEQKLKDAGLNEVLIFLPKTTDRFAINYSILEGIIQLKIGTGVVVNEDNVLKLLETIKMTPEIKVLNQNIDDIIKFSFVVHPLNSKAIFSHTYLKHIQNYSKPLEKLAEEIISYAPGFYYGKIDGIVSEKNGQKVSGIIYTITETPKKMMESSPGIIYKKILKLCEKANEQGAKIMGLGAYTKIVGDAGVTIDRLSPIPVTTGNSLSAASTLWAAKMAVDKLGFVAKEKNLFKGTVMVVGATGSIGAVLSKILSLTWKEIIIVAPRAYKLIELKEDILKINPKANIIVSTDSDTYSYKCDLIITTTSGQGKTILDIMKVKPGCVICDVSRPFDISEQDAIKRPDVLVIASGEVQLPGKDLKIGMDIGLEGNIVYACLAETALLAMEGKFESFTLSRHINYERVLEIDKLAKEHGVRLSQIMGHNGFITDEEFSLCREHALNNQNK